MKPAALMLACILAAAALAACESEGDAPAPVAVEDQSGDYFREEETEDLAVWIEIPAAARTVPVLGEQLIARAEAEAADAARRAGERRRERPAGFSPSQLLITWTVAYDDGGVLSLSGLTRTYEGGVDVVESRTSLLYDRVAGRQLSVADLFADPRAGGAGMTALSEAAFTSWTEISPAVRGRDLALVDEYALANARETLRPRASSFATFVLVPSEADKLGGVNLLYPEGQLGPRTEGPFTLFVPADAIAAYLKPEWRARLASQADLED